MVKRSFGTKKPEAEKKVVIEPADIGKGRSFRTPEEEMLDLLQKHFGDDIKLKSFHFAMEAPNGEVNISWKAH